MFITCLLICLPFKLVFSKTNRETGRETRVPTVTLSWLLQTQTVSIQRPVNETRLPFTESFTDLWVLMNSIWQISHFLPLFFAPPLHWPGWTRCVSSPGLITIQVRAVSPEAEDKSHCSPGERRRYINITWWLHAYMCECVYIFWL